MAVGKLNGAFEPGTKAFELKNPMLLKTYRPEKKTDSEHYRVFTTFSGGIKAAISDVLAKTSGEPNKLNEANTIRDLMHLYGFHTDLSFKPMVAYLKRAFSDPDITPDTQISYFKEPKEGVMNARS